MDVTQRCARCGGRRYTQLASGEALCEACLDQHCRERGLDPGEVKAALMQLSRAVQDVVLAIMQHDQRQERAA